MKGLQPYYHSPILEAGCDEAGRGCLCGPVFAAAVILPEGYIPEGLNDSKKLSASARERLRNEIESNAVSWAVASVSAEDIDKMNILAASIHAMHLALGNLSVKPSFIIVDGNRFKPFPDIQHSTIVKGDARYASIAAASILAKTHRDEFMLNAAQKYPGYGWEQNMGYPTKAHVEALGQLGLTPLHRRTFGPCARILDKSE